MFQVVEHWLETTGPEVMRAMIAATDWVVDEQESVELHAGDSDTLFAVRATPFSWQGASVESMTLWMGLPGQVRRQDTTANAFGFSAESTTYHFGWGEPVEIPIPE